MSTRCQIEFYDPDPTDGAEPEARLYKHSDCYPKGILSMLLYLQSVLKKDIPSYGPRLDDPEWAAAEFVTQFTQHLRPDIEYLYRAECRPDKWVIRIYTPKFDAKHDIMGFEEASPPRSSC